MTRFVTDDGTDSGTLMEIRRHYVQDGKHIPSPALPVGPTAISDGEIPSPTASYDSITDAFCDAENALYHGSGTFHKHGALGSIDAAAEDGFVLGKRHSFGRSATFACAPLHATHTVSRSLLSLFSALGLG